MNLVISFCFVLILSVYANQVTVPIQQYPAYQQSVYNSPTIPVVYQTAASSYSNPCAHYSIAQNQSPNQLANALVNKVLSSPTVHRIFDPNSRFYSQNGEEYQKPIYSQSPAPNIINNYFIVPPEFLKLNESELSTLVQLPNIVNNGINHNAAENVEVLIHTPQSTLATKENLVQTNQEVSLSSITSPQITPCRKVRRKKARKRVRGKLLIPQTIIKENVPDISTCNPQSQQQHLENHENVPEEMESCIKDQINDDIDIDVQQKQPETSNDDSIPPDDKKRRRKKSKKRKKPKNASNSDYTPNTEVDCNENRDYTKIASQKKNLHEQSTNEGVSIEATVQEKNKKPEQTVPSTSRKELNEDCFQDLGSLITCLSDSDNRVTRNSEDEAILRDLRQNFPDVPETVARNMLSFVQNQYRNQCHNQHQCQVHNPFYYPGLPFGFDQIYQMPYMYNYGKNNHGNNKPKSKNRNRKSKKRKTRNKKRNNPDDNAVTPKLSDLKLQNTEHIEDHIESTTLRAEDLITNVIETTEKVHLQIEDVSLETPTTILPLITEMTVPESEETQSYYDYNKNLDSEETHGGYEETDFGHHENEMPGEEDSVPIIYTNGLIDDYYPTFIDNAYYANNNEYTVADLNDRYYYTTDRNLETFGRKLESFKEIVPIKLKESFRDSLPKHTYVDAERESYKNLIKEVIQPKSQFKHQATPKIQKEMFKTPPALEKPDFKTKKIYKDPLDLEDFRIENAFDGVSPYFNYEEPLHSNAKSINYNKMKANVERDFVQERPAKSNVGGVETLFARSKVAKYGVENDEVTPELTTIKNFEDQKISVVTAQSLIYSEEVL